MSYREAAQALATTVQGACPSGAPAWLTWGLGGLTMAAISMDLWTMRQLAKKDDEPSLHQKMAQYYFDRAAEMQGKPVVSVSSGTSRYLMEEGNTDIKTDCFSCASGHLAATKASVERAAQSMKGGACGDECRKWLNTGAQETASLLAKDWTDEKISAQPEQKKRVLEKYRSQVRGIMTDMFGGNEQAQLINEAAGLLDESLRFTNAGDPIDHPEVDGRLKDAEAALSAAERVDLTTWDTDTANKLRAIRQAVGNKVNTPEDLKMVRTQARELANSINSQVFGQLDKGRINDLNNRTSRIYDGFKRDRQHVESPKETKEQKVEHIRTGLRKAV